MKPTYLLAALLAAYLPAAGAVDFNKDALKSMQEEGHKMLDEEQSARAFKLSSGQCLHAAGKTGGKLVINKCNAKSNNQKWSFDDQGRLVNNGGNCVGLAGDAGKPGANAVMQKCGKGKSQQWKLDGKKRLVNGGKNCLQPDGGGARAGASVVTANCGNSPDQAWQ